MLATVIDWRRDLRCQAKEATMVSRWLGRFGLLLTLLAGCGAPYAEADRPTRSAMTIARAGGRVGARTGGRVGTGVARPATRPATLPATRPGQHGSGTQWQRPTAGDRDTHIRHRTDIDVNRYYGGVGRYGAYGNPYVAARYVTPAIAPVAVPVAVPPAVIVMPQTVVVPSASDAGATAAQPPQAP
jgi:hypothetical protein